MAVTTLAWSDYTGRIAVGRIQAGKVKKGDPVTIIKAAKNINARIEKVELFDRLGKVEAAEARAGDIVALTGLQVSEIGDTIADPTHLVPLERLKVDEPTLTMLFTINDSPFAGREGDFVTSRHLRDRLMRELDSNVALRVEDGALLGHIAFSPVINEFNGYRSVEMHLVDWRPSNDAATPGRRPRRNTGR